MTYTHITVERSHQDRVATITMRRPEVHNAFNGQLIQDLQAAFTELVPDEKLHAVVLTGDGPSFSAGADVSMMKEAAAYSQEQNLSDALRLADLFDTINGFPCPVVARVNGTAMGGGAGLIAVCDIVIAAENARLAFSEVKMGIAPAVISPYVVRKIGESYARVLFFFFSSRRRHTRYWRDWSSDVCSSDLASATGDRTDHLSQSFSLRAQFAAAQLEAAACADCESQGAERCAGVPVSHFAKRRDRKSVV